MKSRHDNRGSDERPTLLYGVTVGFTAWTMIRGQLEWFANHGWEVVLVTSPDQDAARTVAREGIGFFGIPMKRSISIRADLRALFAWIGLLRQLRPDAVNVGTPKAGLLGGLAAWLTRVPRRVYVVRGLRLEGARGLMRAILWLMERLTTAIATDVVVVSRSLATELQRTRLVNPKKAWLIGAGSSNGVHAEAIAARIESVDPGELRTALGLSRDSFVVGYVGRIATDKGIGTMIEAMESGGLDECIEYLFIGPVEDSKLKAEIQAIGPRVRSVPFTTDVWGHLPAMDALCLPTLREGFPNVVLEAAAAGIPAVTTRATGAVDSVEDGETGLLFNVGDAKALVDNLNQLARKPELTSRLGEAAKRRACEHFRPEQIWEGLASIVDGRYGDAALTRVDKLPAAGGRW